MMITTSVMIVAVSLIFPYKTSPVTDIIQKMQDMKDGDDDDDQEGIVKGIRRYNLPDDVNSENTEDDDLCSDGSLSSNPFVSSPSSQSSNNDIQIQRFVETTVSVCTVGEKHQIPMSLRR
jgi:hypothetical protein